MLNLNLVAKLHPDGEPPDYITAVKAAGHKLTACDSLKVRFFTASLDLTSNPAGVLVFSKAFVHLLVLGISDCGFERERVPCGIIHRSSRSRDHLACLCDVRHGPTRFPLFAMSLKLE